MGEVLLKADSVGEVMLGGIVLSGTYQSMRIRRSVRLDEARIPGRSGASKRPQGFSDVEVDLVLACAGDGENTSEDKAASIIALFQSQDSLARPFVYEITHRLLNQAWGVRDVIFQDCDSADDNTSDIVWLTLKFVEYKPIALRRGEARKNKVVVSSDPVLGPSLEEFDSEAPGDTTPTILADPEYLAKGVPENNGQTIYTGAGKTPAQDTDRYEGYGELD